jgi:hypothetical protein
LTTAAYADNHARMKANHQKATKEALDLPSEARAALMILTWDE